MGESAVKLAGDATSTDPQVGLAGVAELRELLEVLERVQVEHARAQGWSWQRIANVLAVSKQAIHKKHGADHPERRRMP